MKVINLWGAPSSGKSTNAAGLFYLMKLDKFKVEIIHEFVKDQIYEEHLSVLNDQNFIFANQNRMLERLRNKVDYVITDSPLPLSLYYCEEKNPNYLKNNPGFESIVWSIFNSYQNINFFLKPDHPFENHGRIHNESESFIIEKNIKKLLIKNNITHYETYTNKNLADELLQIIKTIDLTDNELFSTENHQKIFDIFYEKKQN